MKELVCIVRAEYVDAYRLRLRFSNGDRKVVDFSRWLHGPVFEPLKDVAFFRKFHLSGGTVCWPNGGDIAPETLAAAKDVSRDAA